MYKFRNFMLGILFFFTLALAFFVFAEIFWEKQEAAAVLAAVHTPTVPSKKPVNQPDWVISLDQITAACAHPWVIPRALPVGHIETTVQQKTGLSACYGLAGERAVESHLWHQGVPLSGDRLEGQVTLYFDHDADFAALDAAPVEMVTLAGTVVHDLNGDAEITPGEPVIPGAMICLQRDPLAPLCEKSDAHGHYVFQGILPGVWSFQITSPTHDRLDAFKYTNHLVESGRHIPAATVNGYQRTERVLNLTEFLPIETEILVTVMEDTAYDFFLMHEWATYFAAPHDAELFEITAHYDLDIQPGYIRVYNGARQMTYDQHDGLDAACPAGTEIVSVAEGRVIGILYDSTVVIRHSNQLISVYGHGDPLVAKDQVVPRGYPVALCNNHLTSAAPHLHFAIWHNTPWLHKVSYGVPPFADLADLGHTGEKWVTNHDPLDGDHLVYLLQGGRGVWTEINQPHPPNVRLGVE